MIKNILFCLPTFLLITNSAFSCPNFKSEYCCGPSLGVIQACSDKVVVTQTPVAGGVKYIFSGSDVISGEYLADGQSHPFDGSLGAARMTGDAVISCTDNAVIFDSRNATISNGGVVAHGYYYSGVQINTDGSIKPFEDCSFTTTDGAPVGTTCGGGGFIAIGMACLPHP